MIDFLLQNGFSILMGGITFLSTFVLLRYRVLKLEEIVKDQALSIKNLDTGHTAFLVAITAIQKDIEYIKLQVNKIVP